MSSNPKAPEDVGEYEHYNYDSDKFLHTKGGKGRTKNEAAMNDHQDPGGHTRKIVNKLKNSEEKKLSPKSSN